MVCARTGKTVKEVADKLPDEAVILLSQSEKTPALFQDHQWAVHAARFELLRKFHHADLQRVYPQIASKSHSELQILFIELSCTHLQSQASILSKCHLLKHVTFLQLYLVATDLKISTRVFMEFIAKIDDDYKDDSLLWKVFGRVCDGCYVTLRQPTRCGRCHCSYYCSRECQVSDWKRKHKTLCTPVVDEL